MSDPLLEQQAPPPPLDPHIAAAAVRLGDYCADSPQAWFWNINSTLAMHRITRSRPKFHMAVSKLPVSLMDTIAHL
jgi:hypothetical protein